MKAVDLYRFIVEHDIEWHYYNADDVCGDRKDVVLFINFGDLSDFTNLLSETIFDDGRISCVLKNGYVAIDNLSNICEHYDIELTDVFKIK